MEAERVFGCPVDYYGIGDLVERVRSVTDAEFDKLCAVYDDAYDVVAELRPDGDRHDSLRKAARIEFGMRQPLDDLRAGVVTDTFDDLHGLRQLPGISAQRHG